MSKTTRTKCVPASGAFRDGTLYVEIEERTVIVRRCVCVNADGSKIESDITPEQADSFLRAGEWREIP